MATAADIETDLTLELDGQGVTPDRFQRGTRAFFGVLSEVTKSVCDGKPNVQWRVQVKAGSNLVGIVPVPGFFPDVVNTIAVAMRAGMQSLERGHAQPRFFTEAAMKHARDLAELSNGDEGSDVRIRLWIFREPAVVSHHTVANVMDAFAGEFDDHGSIDGRLQTLSDRGGIRFVIYETLSDRPVHCYIEQEKLEDALRYFRKRVEVYGLIRYRLDGFAQSIRVEDIVPFPDPADVPSFRDVYGILRAKT